MLHRKTLSAGLFRRHNKEELWQQPMMAQRHEQDGHQGQDQQEKTSGP
jgi:hypothetical protein